MTPLRIAAILIVCLTTFTARAADKTDKKSRPVLTPDQRAKVNKLLVEYRNAGTNVDKKQEVCDKVLEIGPAAAPLMLAAVDRDLQPKIKKYNAKFQAQAVAASKRKIGKVDLTEIMELRRTVLDLQKLGDDFTHAIITQKADPAVAKLRAMFILNRSDVLDKSKDLQADRKKLTDLGRLWERCQIQMPTEHLEQDNAEQTKAAPPTFEQYLEDEENLAVSLAAPLDPRTRAVLAMNAKLAEKIDPEEARAVLELNLTRNLLGLPALAIDLNLCAAARSHSADMEKLNFFSHESPVLGKKSFTDRAKLAGTTASAENIYKGSTSGKSANDGWFHSPGHHRNQMGNHARVGVGRTGGIFTQMFGK
jgi:uncharacterized protein YkwD